MGEELFWGWFAPGPYKGKRAGRDDGKSAGLEL
jgi:hypothetical protein